jgi:hypothetical protein
MKQLIWLVLFMLPGVSLADQWLCVADQSTGFFYYESSKKWEQTRFTVDNEKYIVTPSKFKSHKYDVTQLGKKDSAAYCVNEFSAKGDLYCKGESASGHIYTIFNMNHIKGRFVMSQTMGYFSDIKDSPSITIGKCSKF